MPLRIVREDITKIKCDAIVNPTNVNLVPGGGIDAAVHVAAGPELFTACQRLGGLEVGQVKMTPAYNLPCKHVFHTVGPWWEGGHKNEKEKLQDCYRNALLLAKSMKLKSIAIPLISSGTHGYPKDQVMDVGIDVIKKFLETSDMKVYFVVFDKKAFSLAEDLEESIRQLIDDRYVEQSYDENLMALDEVVFSKLNKYEKRRIESLKETRVRDIRRNYKANQTTNRQHPYDLIESVYSCEELEIRFNSDAYPKSEKEIAKWLEQKAKPFQTLMFEYLDKYLDKHKMKESDFYNKLNMERQYWSKIKTGKNGFVPIKGSVIAIGIALGLTRNQMDKLLAKAGYALSDYNKFDRVIMACISLGINDVFKVEQILFANNQKSLLSYK